MVDINQNRHNSYPTYNSSFSNYNVYDFTKFEYDRSQVATKTYNQDETLASTMLHGTKVDVTPLSQAYFSNENIKYLQQQIKLQIKKMSNGKVTLSVDQDKDDLLVVMRSNFLEHARFLPYDIKGQIKELDKKLIKAIIPDIVTGIKQQYFYLKELTKPIEPIALPLDVSSKGRRTLPSFDFSL